MDCHELTNLGEEYSNDFQKDNMEKILMIQQCYSENDYGRNVRNTAIIFIIGYGKDAKNIAMICR